MQQKQTWPRSALCAIRPMAPREPSAAPLRTPPTINKRASTVAHSTCSHHLAWGNPNWSPARKPTSSPGKIHSQARCSDTEHTQLASRGQSHESSARDVSWHLLKGSRGPQIQQKRAGSSGNPSWQREGERWGTSGAQLAIFLTVAPLREFTMRRATHSATRKQPVRRARNCRHNGSPHCSNGNLQTCAGIQQPGYKLWKAWKNALSMEGLEIMETRDNKSANP